MGQREGEGRTVDGGVIPVRDRIHRVPAWVEGKSINLSPGNQIRDSTFLGHFLGITCTASAFVEDRGGVRVLKEGGGREGTRR